MKGWKMEYFDFRKTLSRNEYWPRFIFLTFLGILGSCAAVVLQTPVFATYIAVVIGFVSSLFVSIALFFMIAQRLNDLNASPWLAVLTIVPVLNILLFMAMGVLPKRN